MVVLRTTAMLSPTRTEVGSRLTPNIYKLYLKAIINSIAILDATISDPYVEDSTIFWHLDSHETGVLFSKTTIPDTDLLVSWSLAWSAFTYVVMVHSFPIGLGLSDGTFSTVSG